MRWTIRIGLVVLVLLAAYTAWPLYGLYRIAAAVEARNAAELNELTDVPSLRRSLTQQLVATYLKLSGKGVGLGDAATSLAVGLGATVADPLVARLLNPETLLDLLNKGSAGAGAGSGAAAGIAPFASGGGGNLWRTWTNSEYSGTNFYVSMPPDLPAARQFRVRLRVVQGKWKLAGVDLPEELRVRLAQELLKPS